MIDWSLNNKKISQYFTVGEVTNREKRRQPINGSEVEKNVLRLAWELDVLRLKWKSGIGVTSWYRPKQVNAEVGGSINSQHILGLAVDVYPINGRDAQFEEFCDRNWKNKALGYGMASGRGFVHLDLRTGGLRWFY
jgi:putative chitinase